MCEVVDKIDTMEGRIKSKVISCLALNLLVLATISAFWQIIGLDFSTGLSGIFIFITAFIAGGISFLGCSFMIKL